MPPGPEGTLDSRPHVDRLSNNHADSIQDLFGMGHTVSKSTLERIRATYAASLEQVIRNE
jgi:hypothetical protein